MPWPRETFSLLLTRLIGATGGVWGTIGVSEIVEALSDPEKAKNFATRIRDLFRDGDINDWVGTVWLADMTLVGKRLEPVLTSQ